MESSTQIDIGPSFYSDLRKYLRPGEAVSEKMLENMVETNRPSRHSHVAVLYGGGKSGRGRVQILDVKSFKDLILLPISTMIEAGVYNSYYDGLRCCFEMVEDVEVLAISSTTTESLIRIWTARGLSVVTRI